MLFAAAEPGRNQSEDPAAVSVQRHCSRAPAKEAQAAGGRGEAGVFCSAVSAAVLWTSMRPSVSAAVLWTSMRPSVSVAVLWPSMRPSVCVAVLWPNMRPSVSASCALDQYASKRFCINGVRCLTVLQDDYNLKEILESFQLPEGKLVFSFEELCKATSMSKTVSPAVVQWLVCHSAVFLQLSSSVLYNCRHLYIYM